MSAGATVVAADEANFAKVVLAASRERWVMVDFWADWCSPCRALTPLLERVVPDYAPALQLVTVEVDENMRLAGRYQLRGFPTVILFRGGEEIGRFSGFKPEAWLREFIEDAVVPTV